MSYFCLTHIRQTTWWRFYFWDVKNKSVEILVNDRSQLAAVQNKFSETYKFLKLEFVAKQQKAGTSQSIYKPMMIDGKLVRDLSRVAANASLFISPHSTIAAVKDGFKSLFGLDVQVLRKSANSWLETTLTDYWTLEEQNREGEKLSGSM